MTLRVVGKRTLDRLVSAYLGHRLSAALHEQKQAELVHLIRDVLFYEETAERTEEDKRTRREETLEALLSFFRCPLLASP